MRHHDAKLSLGERHTIVIRVKNRSPFSLTLTLKDGAPPSFTVESKVMTLEVPPWQERRTQYSVVPTARGDHHFGPVYYRYRGVLSFVIRQAAHADDRVVSVYPDLMSVARYELSVRRRHLLHPGFKVSRLKGRGLELESLRDYLPDDDYRLINWKATARRRSPITQEYRAEKRHNVLLLLDCGRIMHAKVGALSKLDHSVNTALLLAYVGLREGDRVGLLAFSQEILQHIPPKEGRHQFKAITDALYNITPGLVEPDYRRAFGTLYLGSRHRSLVIVFSDLIDLDASSTLLSYLSVLVTRHLPLLITIRDPGLRQFVELPLRNSETVHQKAQAIETVQRRQVALTKLKHAGVGVLDHTPEELSVSLVNRYLQIKQRGLL